jgi:mono/diheme cytochrome c family protein
LLRPLSQSSSARRRLAARAPKPARLLFLISLVLISGNVACWEQWSEDWFPQMKWQRAIQAFERVPHETLDKPALNPFMPPEGAVQLGAEPPVVPVVKPEEMTEQTLAAFDAAVATFVNPTRPDPAQPVPFQSLVRGKELWAIYCTTCHGPAGMGDGPVSMANLEKAGPFAGVFPVVTATSRSDGYIYNLIRGGGARMPSYQRIAPEDRWHLVNYVRHLQNGGQP